MKINRAYKTELDPNKKQLESLKKHAGAARFAFNWGLARRIEEYKKTEKFPNAIEQHKQLNALKETEFPWMYEVSKCAPQEALRNLDQAYANFFRRLKLLKEGKLKGKVGFPKFKSKKRGLGSFRLTGAIHVSDSYVSLPRIGKVRLKEKGYIKTEGVKINSATVSARAGRWFVSISVEQEIEVSAGEGPPIGVDLGLKKMAVCSTGQTFDNPKALRRNLRKLARLQRKLSRQKKESKRREKTRLQIAKLHYRISNIRKDAIHKATSQMVAKNKPPTLRPSAIVVEDLNVAGMLSNRKLSRAIADVSFSELRRQLSYKCSWYFVKLIVADRFFASSKTCSRCGAIKQTLELSEREYVCAECGVILDRDLNAALNLQKLAGSSSERINACGEDVRPTQKVGNPL
ncbi:MAG: IS200/IS605 family element transposase accessory protein TnpB [Deltaproteobacteria bacterium]|nr:IS200/IS605 family element transposase accessory protein TnpB [Deltaproteobacteria bacterium]